MYVLEFWGSCVCVFLCGCVCTVVSFYHTAIWLYAMVCQGRPSPLTRLYLTAVLLLLCAQLCACYSCAKCASVSVQASERER